MQRHGLMRLLVGAVLAVLISGCAITAPIYSVTNAPARGAREVSFEELRGAINRAAQAQHWSLREEAPGRLLATYALANRIAVVEITHNDRHYSLRYRNSVNMGYDGTRLNQSYNEWVRSLEQAIRQELSAL